MTITIDGKDKKTLIYVMNQYFDYHLPSEKYITTCMDGYEDFGFDKSILEKALVDTMDSFTKKLKK